MPTYENQPYSVNVSDNGEIAVKSGDCLSAYSWAIYGNYTTLGVFARLDANGNPLVIENKNLIYAGETLLHLPDYKKGGSKPPVTSKPPTTGGGKPPAGTPAQKPTTSTGPKAQNVVNLNHTQGSIVTPFEFVYTCDIPTTGQLSVKYFYYTWYFYASGNTQQTAGPVVPGVSAQGARVALSQKLTERFTLGAYMTMEDFVKKIVPAMHSKAAFLTALGEFVSVGTSFPFGIGSVELSTRFSQLPFYIGVSSNPVKFDRIPIDSVYHDVWLTVKGGFYFAPRVEAWLELLWKVGRAAMNALSKILGSEAAACMAQAGVVIAGVAAVNFAWAYFLDWALKSGLENAALKAKASWYISAYKQMVFNDMSAPRGGTAEDQKLVELARKDAVESARAELRLLQHPGAGDPEDFYVLNVYEGMLIHECGSKGNAETKMQNDLTDQMYRELGIRPGL